MKLLALILLIIPLCLMPFSKKSEEVIYPIYKDGDILEYDGLIYEYDVFSFDENDNVIAPIYDYKEPVDALYHKAYYFDMIHPENYPDINERVFTTQLAHITSETINNNVIYNSYNYGYSIFNPIVGKFYGPEGDVITADYLEYVTSDEEAFEVYLKLKIIKRLNDDKMPGFWWVKGVSDENQREYNIPSRLNGTYVLGIGYSALTGFTNKPTITIMANEPFSLDDDKVSLLSQTLPFLFMPYAISDTTIGVMNIKRNALLLSSALNNSNLGNMHFDYLASLDAGFNNSKIYILSINRLYVSQYYTQVDEFLLLASSFGYIYPLFNNCDIYAVECPQIIKFTENVYYATAACPPDNNNADDFYLNARLCSNFAKPKVLYLGDGHPLAMYISDNKINNFLLAAGFLSELECIIVPEYSSYYVIGNDLYIKLRYLDDMLYHKTRDIKLCELKNDVKVIKLKGNYE